MVVAIIGIWIGACVWRKRYIRKKDREYALGKNLAHRTESGRVAMNASNPGSVHVPAAGIFTPAPIAAAGVYEEKVKKAKKKWIVKERTWQDEGNMGVTAKGHGNRRGRIGIMTRKNIDNPDTQGNGAA
jgi:hypothetical protein